MSHPILSTIFISNDDAFIAFLVSLFSLEFIICFFSYLPNKNDIGVALNNFIILSTWKCIFFLLENKLTQYLIITSYQIPILLDNYISFWIPLGMYLSII